MGKDSEPALQQTGTVSEKWILQPGRQHQKTGPKGHIRRSWSITANSTSRKEKLVGSGDARVAIEGQDSELTADDVMYDPATEILKARGHVRIIRKGMLITGAEYRFKLASPEYLVTEDDVALAKPQLITRNKRH